MLKKRPLRCSFCRKNESEVLKLVAGPRVYICDACVAIASQLMEGNSYDDNQQAKVKPAIWRKILRNAGKFLRGGNTRRILAAADGVSSY